MPAAGVVTIILALVAVAALATYLVRVVLVLKHVNFTLGTGTTFSASTFTHSVAGNFSNSGTFNGNSSTFGVPSGEIMSPA